MASKRSTRKETEEEKDKRYREAWKKSGSPGSYETWSRKTQRLTGEYIEKPRTIQEGVSHKGRLQDKYPDMKQKHKAAIEAARPWYKKLNRSKPKTTTEKESAASLLTNYASGTSDPTKKYKRSGKKK